MTRDGAAPRVLELELASYHAILACVAAGNCAGVVPRSVLALMAELAKDAPKRRGARTAPRR